MKMIPNEEDEFCCEFGYTLEHSENSFFFTNGGMFFFQVKESSVLLSYVPIFGVEWKMF